MHVTNAPMTRSDSPTIAALAIETAARDGAEQLQGVLSRVDAFLAGWLDRYEHSFDAAAATPTFPTTAPAAAPTAAESQSPSQALAQRIAQFEIEKRRWEAERQSETRRLQEKFEQLGEAWLHLEAERRNLLQAMQAQRGRRPSPAGDACVSGTGAANRSVASPALTDRSSDSAAAVPAFPHADPAAGHENQAASKQAVQQFQQLRQQIESNRVPRDSR